MFTSDEAASPEPLTSPAPVRRRHRLVVRTGTRLLVVPAASIDWIESADNYAILHVGHETHVVRETLMDLEAELTGALFLRLSRGVLVNIDRVREIRQDQGSYAVVLGDGKQLPITRGIREVLARLEGA